MIILPWRTDVVTRHKPWATLGLLATILLVFVVVRLEPKAKQWLVLEYGAFNPLTWVTSLLVSTSLVLLPINLFGIWTFGWIVEGLVGPRVFLAIFFAVGVAEGGLEQVLMLGADSGVGYGPGAAIYALMACAAVWVPENHITAWMLIVIYPWGNQTFRVVGYVAFWTGLHLFFSLVLGFSFGSSMLRVFAAAAGVAIAMQLLKRGLVDCDGADFFTLRAARIEKERTFKERVIASQSGRADASGGGDLLTPDAEEPAAAPEHTEPIESSMSADPLAAALARVRKELDSEDGVAAALVYDQERRALPEWALPQDDFVRLINLNLECQDYARADPLMAHFIETYPADAVEMRLQLARIQIARRRPTPAQTTLGGLEDSELTEAQKERQDKLAAQAQQQIDDGVLELD